MTPPDRMFPPGTEPVQVFTLGTFEVWREGVLLSPKIWGRDKTLQLFQYFITARRRKAQHREQIIDRLWEEDGDTGEQSFKVALHGLSKVLEPDKKSHAESRFVARQGQTYQLRTADLWIDADALEAHIAKGNQQAASDPVAAIASYTAAIELYKGPYLPDRIYEDWSCDERERLQVQALGAMISLGEMLLAENPAESIRLAQQALLLDPTWEEAYRIQMQGWLSRGNRPMAIKTYQVCAKVLEAEMGIPPLPETKKLLQTILAL